MNDSIQAPQPGDQHSPIVPLARPTPAALERRYLEAINALIEDTRDNDSLRILVDVLAWQLASIIVWNGTRWGAGDVMRRIGDYVCKLVERERAQAEAKRAREEGLHPH